MKKVEVVEMHMTSTSKFPAEALYIFQRLYINDYPRSYILSRFIFFNDSSHISGRGGICSLRSRSKYVPTFPVMLPSTLSTPLATAFSLFVVSPLLLFLSLPLFIWGAITVFFSFTALFLRVSLVYIELSLALARNYVLAIPDPSPSLDLKVSGEAPSTPSRSYARGLHRPHQYRPLQGVRTISPAPNSRGEKVRRRRSAGCVEGSSLGSRKSGNTSYQNRASLPLPTAFQALTCGDQNRDFEGIGGWRTGSPTSHRLQTQSYPNTPGDEAEDRAWTSFNRRLELPSAAGPFVTRGTVTATSHGLSLSTGNAEDDGEGGRGYGRAWISGSALPSPEARKRHHRRSVTTSCLPYPNKDGTSNHPLSPRQQQISGSVTWQTHHRRTPSVTFTNTAPAHIRGTASEGYFSLMSSGDAIYTTPLGEKANIGKSTKRVRRRSLSTTKTAMK